MVGLIYFGFIIRIVIVLCAGVPLLWAGCQALSRVLRRYTSSHISVLVGNIVLYMGCAFLGISILHDLGFNLSAFLGAAGILGIAVGFAAQTSISNIISGVFLVLEGSCAIGDQIEHDGLVGTIESIDLLSVKVRTLDNTFVRIPNEFFIKKIIVNKTYYPTQIVTFKVCVSVEYDVQLIKSLLHDVVLDDTLFLHRPAAKIHLFEINPSYVAGYESPYLINEIKVEITVQKGTAGRAREAFVAAAQKKLYKEGIKAAMVRL